MMRGLILAAMVACLALPALADSPWMNTPGQMLSLDNPKLEPMPFVVFDNRGQVIFSIDSKGNATVRDDADVNETARLVIEALGLRLSCAPGDAK